MFNDNKNTASHFARKFLDRLANSRSSWGDNGIDELEQCERIQVTEAALNRLTAGIERLNAALDEYSDFQADYELLEEYYSSKLWQKDFRDDERDILPKDLPRGVLSEDGIYNALAEKDALYERLESLM